MANEKEWLSPETHAMLAEAARRASRGPIRRLIRKALPPTTAEYKGISFHIHPATNYTDFHIWLRGHPKEHRSLDLIVDLVRDRKVAFLDVGANMGLYSLWVAHHAAEGSAVIAFEPNPVMAERLSTNIALNNGAADIVVVVAHAVGSSPGEATLYVPLSNAGEASLRRLDDVEVASIEVPIVPLLDHLPTVDAGWESVILKADIEGFEDTALANLTTCDAGLLPDAILLEVTHRARWQSDIVANLMARGYQKEASMEGNLLLRRA